MSSRPEPTKLHLLVIIFLLISYVMAWQSAVAQDTSSAPINARSTAYIKPALVAPEWFVAYRTDAGYMLDPIDEMTTCPQALEAEISQRHFTSNGALQDGLRHFWVHPVSIRLPAQQQADLARFQKKPLWLIEETGVRPIRLPNLLARSFETYGPCMHLSSFPVTEPKRVNTADFSEVIVSVKAQPAGTRIIRAINPAHNAFNQLPETNSGTTPEERAIAAWVLKQPSVLKAFEKDLPKPEPKERHHLCVPSFQPFNATLDGQLRSMLSLRLQWCNCEQASSDVPNAPCAKFEFPYNNKVHWLAIVERRGQSAGIVWASSLQSGDALQFMHLKGIVTRPSIGDDILWIGDIHYEGYSTSLMQRVPRATKLRSIKISSYSGL